MKIEDINLCDLGQFTAGCPEAAFKTLRGQAPVWFHPANEQTPGNEGFWVIAKHADAKAALKNHQVFSSETGNGARVGGGTTLDDMSTDMAPGVVLAMMDPPKHDAIRGIVNQGFFPKNLAALEAQIQALADTILDKALEGIDDTTVWKLISCNRSRRNCHCKPFVSWVVCHVKTGRKCRNGRMPPSVLQRTTTLPIPRP